MADQKQGGQGQGGQSQGTPPADVQKTQEQAKAKAQEVVDRGREYQTRYEAYVTKYNAAWANYYKKTAEAYNEYQEDLKGIHEGARKASLAQPAVDDKDPAKTFEAYKAARAKNLNAELEVQQRVHTAERKYSTKLTSFWEDAYNSVAEAIADFWNWLIGWWEEPPVEGAGRRLMLADPAWRVAFEPGATAPYYTGWDYGAKLY